MEYKYKKFNQLMEKYDMTADGVEDNLVAHLREVFPNSYKKSQNDLAKQGADGHVLPSPSAIWGNISQDNKSEHQFFQVVDDWFFVNSKNKINKLVDDENFKF